MTSTLAASLKTDYYERALDRMLLTGKKPTYPPGGFCLYSTLRRKQILRENPRCSQQKLFKAISTEWKKLKDKEPFQAKARRDYKDYKRLLALHGQLWQTQETPSGPTQNASSRPSFSQLDTPDFREKQPKAGGDSFERRSEPGEKCSSLEQPQESLRKPQLWVKLDFSEPPFRKLNWASLSSMEHNDHMHHEASRLKVNHWPQSLPSAEAEAGPKASQELPLAADFDDLDSSASIWTSSDELELKEQQTQQPCGDKQPLPSTIRSYSSVRKVKDSQRGSAVFPSDEARPAEMLLLPSAADNLVEDQEKNRKPSYAQGSDSVSCAFKLEF